MIPMRASQQNITTMMLRFFQESWDPSRISEIGIIHYQPKYQRLLVSTFPSAGNNSRLPTEEVLVAKSERHLFVVSRAVYGTFRTIQNPRKYSAIFSIIVTQKGRRTCAWLVFSTDAAVLFTFLFPRLMDIFLSFGCQVRYKFQCRGLFHSALRLRILLHRVICRFFCHCCSFLVDPTNEFAPFLFSGTRIFGLQLQVGYRPDAAASTSKPVHLPNLSIYRPWSETKCDYAPSHCSPLVRRTTRIRVEFSPAVRSILPLYFCSRHRQKVSS
jgi:hypothetical protein